MSGFSLSPDALRRSTPQRATLRGRVQAERAEGWLTWLALALRSIGTRRQLAQMDDRMLQDIGLTRAEALQEAARAPWDFDTRR
jgi:uncharacterized protein YjiS (DUF1127 family)